MRIFISVVFVFIGIFIFGQVNTNLSDVIIVPSNTKNFDLFKRPKTDFYKKWIKKYVSNSGFVDVEKSSNKLIFRISSLTNAVTINTEDYENFQGTFTRYVNCPNDKFDSHSKQIDSTISKKIYNILVSNSVFNIPSDNEISGWSAGFDGREILIEKKENGNYSINEYWTPEIFPNISEAQLINKIDKEIFDLLKEYDFSEDLLEKDCEYAYNGIKGIKIDNIKTKKTKKMK